MTFDEQVHAFVNLVVTGRSLDAIERFYSDDVQVYENYDPPRVGKQHNFEHERRNLEALREPLSIEARAIATNAAVGISMIEWHMTFTFKDGLRRRLEEVAVQRWRDGKIVSERFFYQRLIEPAAKG